jgi:hypothetical protein
MFTPRSAVAAASPAATSKTDARTVDQSLPTATPSQPLLTLSSLLLLRPPPGLPLVLTHPCTLFALDSHRRGCVSEQDWLALIAQAERVTRERKWKQHEIKDKLTAYLVERMYLAKAEEEQREASEMDEKIASTTTADEKPPAGSTKSVPFVQWFLSLLVNNSPTTSFKHVGLRVLYLHRESVQLLWDLLRAFFPRPPATAALANHHAADSEAQPSMWFEQLAAQSPSLSSCNSALGTHSFQSFFDLLQHTAEHAGLLDLDDAVLDHFVPLAIVEQVVTQFERSFRASMQRVGFPLAPSEIRAKEKLVQEAAEAAALAKAQASQPSVPHHSSHRSFGSARGSPAGVNRGLSHSAARRSLGAGEDLFTVLAAPTPRSFITPRASLGLNIALPHSSPNKHLLSPSSQSSTINGGEKSTRGETHRLRSVVEEGAASPGGLLDLSAEAVDEDDDTTALDQLAPTSLDTAFDFAATVEDLRLPLHAIPPIDFGASGCPTSKTEDTPELLTPTSSHRSHARKPPPGIPSLTFSVQSHGNGSGGDGRAGARDQPLSGQLGSATGAKRSALAANSALHSHSSSVPSMPHSAVSIASTTLQPNTGVSSLPSGQTSHTSSLSATPLISPHSGSYAAFLSVNQGRRATGPTPAKSSLTGSQQQSARNGVPSLHLPNSPQRGNASPAMGSPQLSASTRQQYAYTHRMGMHTPSGQFITQFSAVSLTPLRPLPGGAPYTPHRLHFHTNSTSSLPSGSPTTRDMPTGAGTLDGPLPAAHASLLQAASELTAHVHHVHDISALSERQVRQLVRDGADSDDDDDEGGLTFETSVEDIDAAMAKAAITTPAVLVEEVVELHKRKPKGDKPSAPVKSILKSSSKKDPSASPPAPANAAKKDPVPSAAAPRKAALSRQNSSSSVAAARSTANTAARRSSGAIAPPVAKNPSLKSPTNNKATKAPAADRKDSASSTPPAASPSQLTSCASSPVLNVAPLELVSAVPTLTATVCASPPLKASPSAPKLGVQIPSFLKPAPLVTTPPVARNAANVHPFGATTSPDSKAVPFATQLKAAESQLISPAPRKTMVAAKQKADATKALPAK